MGKDRTRTLSGAAQAAYLRRLLEAHGNVPAAAREELLGALAREIAQLRVRSPAADALVRRPRSSPTKRRAATGAQATRPPVPEPIGRDFDPFSPNVVLIVRQSGRGAALAALAAIDGIDKLRLLAHEQRLSINAELSSPAELRAAIVAAAERRIANRMAAAR